MRIREERWTAELALLVVCLIWGCNFAIMKTALADLHPFAFNTIRLTLSAVFLGASHTAGFINLVPVIALAVGWLALGEPITAFQIAGGALVLGGVWTMHRARVKS